MAKKPAAAKKPATPRKRAAPKKKAVASSEAALSPCAYSDMATTLAEHFRHRKSVTPDCLPLWESHGRWLAKKEGVRFGPR